MHGGTCAREGELVPMKDKNGGILALNQSKAIPKPFRAVLQNFAVFATGLLQGMARNLSCGVARAG